MILLLTIFCILAFFFLTLTASAFTVRTPAEVEDFITYQAMRQGVPVSLALSIAYCESGFVPTAQNPHSPASGIFQFMPETWKYVNRLLLWNQVQNIFDPTLNIIAGIYLLKTVGTSDWTASQSCWQTWASL